ncbi:MAG TPA: MarR family transcriptional regulator [Nocardioidaceae bacterium]|jgi:DNA-binding MarR family transcriptional regulator|nr:MarR family transcriptional regulator [Nocardioidaceae bacterium]
MDGVTERIEQQMTMLLRRVQSIHISTSSGEMDLDRSAYGILCRLADEGPQRLGMLASAFGLDPSTITRQVQALEKAALVHRRADDVDRRASILDLSEEGREVLERTRAYRRERLEEVLSGWAAHDRTEFARLLTKANDSISAMVERRVRETR